MKPTLARGWHAGLGSLLAVVVALGSTTAARAQPVDDRVITDAREALRKNDKPRLAMLRQAAEGHPLAPWADYWELSSRLAQAQQGDVDAFYARWGGT